VANTTTETTLFSTGVGTLTLPANFLKVGQTILVKLEGTHGGTANPTLTINCYLGATLIATGNFTENNVSNEWLKIEFACTVRTVGATGTVMTQGHYESSEPKIYAVRNGTSTSAVTVDTTASLTIDVKAQWSAANAANTITITNASVEVVN
jgi:hypothetical protein